MPKLAAQLAGSYSNQMLQALLIALLLPLLRLLAPMLACAQGAQSQKRQVRWNSTPAEGLVAGPSGSDAGVAALPTNSPWRRTARSSAPGTWLRGVRRWCSRGLACPADEAQQPAMLACCQTASWPAPRQPGAQRKGGGALKRQFLGCNSRSTGGCGRKAHNQLAQGESVRHTCANNARWPTTQASNEIA